MGGGTKEHNEKVRKSKFNRQRAETPTLRANCGSDGYVFTNPVNDLASGQCEFHHVLPISSLQDGEIKKQGEELEFIIKCMCKTTWDINEQPNMLGLPTKEPYDAADRKAATGSTVADLVALNAAIGEFGSLPDLPCHMNDHDKFTTAVINKLNSTVWPQLVADRAKCKNRGKSIRKMLQDASNEWKDWLKTRGGSNGGAADCWVNRETTKRPVWYIPLSMAPKPRKSDPPPNIHKRGKMTIADWLEKIFSWA